MTHFQNPLSARSPSFVYREPTTNPSSHPTSPTSSDTDFDFSRSSSTTNNQLPRRYHSGDFDRNKVSPIKDAAPVEEKIINTSPGDPEPAPDDVSQSIDMASNIGEFDDILGDIQSTLSRDTVISNPSTAGRGLPPYPPPRRANDYLPPRNPTLPPRSSPALPPRNPAVSTLPVRSQSREGQEGYVESDL